MSQNSALHASAAPPAGWRPALWLVLLVTASIAFTLGFACAMPFAALGAAAALTLPRRDALLLTGGAWLANQLVGFLALGYPCTADTVTWGGALGVVALLTTFAAEAIVRGLAGRSAALVTATTFAGAFVVYEGALFVISATLLGRTEDYAPAIVGSILALNAVAFVGFLVLDRVGMRVGLAAAPALRLGAAARGA